jgi:hypothetical protein
MTSTAQTATPMPALWHEPAPRHFDLIAPWWIKALVVIVATVAAILFVDQRVAAWADAHRIPDLMHTRADGKSNGDSGRELMFLEQWGQGTCSVLVVLAVALLDRSGADGKAGMRRALALAIGCLLTVAVTHLLKDLVGRSRPFVVPLGGDGHWEWGGPAKEFHLGSSWGSFPSAHTTAAFALSSGLAWFYPRGRALFMGLAAVTATQRVLHTAHYVSDVVAGMGIGVFLMRATLTYKVAGGVLAMMPASVRRHFLASE